jgi:hypothetical protein
MEYISADEFLKQDKEIQKVFLDWWKENVKQYDLFYRNFKGKRQKYIVIKSEGYELETITLRNRKISAGRDAWTEAWNIQFICDIVPLLTEGQLRKFIEDKTNRKIDLSYYQDTGYDICLDNFNGLSKNRHEFHLDLGTDLLQAYWQVALQIAKEKVKA